MMTDNEKLQMVIRALSEACTVRQVWTAIDVDLGGTIEILDADNEVSLRIAVTDVHNEIGRFNVEMKSYPNWVRPIPAGWAVEASEIGEG